MTEGELKFALKVESVLNHIPEPEYRQLMVEALITLTIFAEMNSAKGHFIDMVIPVNDIITKAYLIFLQDQVCRPLYSTFYPQMVDIVRKCNPYQMLLPLCYGLLYKNILL